MEEREREREREREDSSVADRKLAKRDEREDGAKDVARGIKTVASVADVLGCKIGFLARRYSGRESGRRKGSVGSELGEGTHGAHGELDPVQTVILAG